MMNSALNSPGVRRGHYFLPVLCAFSCGSLLIAQTAVADLSPQKPVIGSREIPPALQDATITDKLGAEISSDLTFRDEEGKTVLLADYFKSGKPVILTLGYYGCPMLCSLVLNAVLDAIKPFPSEWKPGGGKFQIVSVSIDPRETPADAKRKKQSYLEELGSQAGSEDSWHFLTGDEAQSRKLAEQVGFGYRWDAKSKDYAHAAGIFVLTPERKLSRTLYGIQFRPQDVKLALLEASNGRIGTVMDRILLFCYQYNSHTRKYSLVATRLVQAGSAGTVLAFGGYLAVFWRRQSRRKDETDSS